MKKILFLAIFLFISSTSEKGKSDNRASAQVKIGGYAGSVIDACIEKRIEGRDTEMLIAPFRVRNETRFWQMEFWGKWMLSAVDAWKYTKNPALMAKMKSAAAALVATQTTDGYIGNYGKENQLTAWDIWGRKYCLLGLLKYYEISSDKAALKAAVKSADYLLSQVGPGKKDIIKTGFYRGMASSSILEPMVYLYKITKNPDYLAFAEYIVAQWETVDGPKLVSKAMANVPVKDRFPAPDSWWSWENGQKAYEMMSCYDGLLELYLVTGKREYFDAVVATADNIMATEINVAGSGSAFECWYGTTALQTRPTYHTMETCVTTTWMKLCYKLLEITSDSRYADQIEKTFYNALMASMKYDASEIAKYSPLEGARVEGENQCNMPINCCNANGPRGFTLIPQYAVMQHGSGFLMNYIGPMTARVVFETGESADITVESTYPESGHVKVHIETGKPLEFTLSLRIPEWSRQTTVKVGDEAFTDATPGKYCKISRTWKNGDIIDLQLDMRGRVVELNGYQTLMRGPLVLARDSRFGDGFVDESAVIKQEEGYVELTETAEKPEHVWMTFTAPLVLGTDLEGAGGKPRLVRFCDFASAGNTWDHSERYRVWIPKTLNVMNRKYEGY